MALPGTLGTPHPLSTPTSGSGMNGSLHILPVFFHSRGTRNLGGGERSTAGRHTEKGCRCCCCSPRPRGSGRRVQRGWEGESVGSMAWHGASTQVPRLVNPIQRRRVPSHSMGLGPPQAARQTGPLVVGGWVRSALTACPATRPSLFSPVGIWTDVGMLLLLVGGEGGGECVSCGA